MRCAVTWVVSACSILSAVSIAAQGTAVGVAAKPTLEIAATAADGTIQLEAPVGATRLSTGAIVVAEINQLRRFSPTGAPVGTVGRAGNGPLEFGYIRGISRCGGDTVLVFDAPKSTLSLLGPDGTLSAGLNMRAAGGPQYSPMDVVCDARGRTVAIITLSGQMAESSPGVLRATSTVLKARLGEWKFDTVAVVPSSELLRFGGGGGPRPLGKNTSIGLVGSSVIVATADSAVLSRIDDAGAASRLTTGAKTRAVRTADKDVALDEFLNSVPAQVRPRVREMMQTAPWPTQTPHYLRVAPSTDGTIWLLVPSATDGTTELLSVPTDRSAPRRIVLPTVARAVEIGRDYVLAVTQTEDGEPVVRSYARDVDSRPARSPQP